MRVFIRINKKLFSVIKTPYMADSITQGTLASWEKSKKRLVLKFKLIFAVCFF